MKKKVKKATKKVMGSKVTKQVVEDEKKIARGLVSKMAAGLKEKLKPKKKK